MQSLGSIAPSGDLGLRIIRGDGTIEELRPRHLTVARLWPDHELSSAEIAHHGLPRKGLSDEVNQWRASNVANLWRGIRRVLLARALHLPTFYGSLFLTVTRGGEELELGLASMRVVTTAGVAYVAACFPGTNEPELMKFHGFGTGTTAESSADTALVTELTTQYATDSTRPTGSQSASTNVYTTVGTLTPDSGGVIAVTEHGIFSANAAGTLLDRSKFSAVNLDSSAGDSLQATYALTLPAGS